MALGFARDDPLAGAPALDAHFTEGERASAPMEKGANGLWAGPFGCPEPSFFAVLGLPVQALHGGIPECDCVWVFCCRRSDKAFPSHLSPVARECFVDLASSSARWTHMVTVKHQGPLHCCVGRRVVQFWGVCSPLVGGILASVDQFGGRLAECDHVCPPVEKGTDGSGLGPFGYPEPFCLIESAELRLACREKYTTGVRPDIFFELPVLSCFSSSFRLSHMLAGAPNSSRLNCVGVWAHGNALGFQRLHYDGSFQGSSQSKGGPYFRRESEKSDVHPLVEPLVRVDPLACAPALDACLKEGELASSPVEKAPGVLWSWPLWVTAPSYCQSVAPKKRGYVDV